MNQTHFPVHFENTQIAFRLKGNKALRRANWLFSMLSFPVLVRFGNAFMNWAMRWHMPITPLVKITVFDHFCCGETLTDCVPVLNKLNEVGVKSVLDYSIEGKETEGQFDQARDTLLELISFSADNPCTPIVVFKPTAFGRFDLFVKKGEGVKLTQTEIVEWHRLVGRFDSVCKAASAQRLPVLIDAEESWMQDAADALVLEMMRVYNKEEALVFNTAQLYRIDRLDYLSRLLQKAENEGFHVGVKLVRGAYMEKERARAAEYGYPSPICATKEVTDENFDKAVTFVLSNLKRMSLYLGTHNEKSTTLAVDTLKNSQIASNDSRVWFGQLYGMSDHISFNLGAAGYNATKYMPFGPIREVIPYLSRRATENTSVSGQTGRELSLIRKELKRRKTSRD